MIAVLKNTILRVIRSPKYVIFCALFPILLVLVIGGLLGKNDGGLKFTGKTVYYTETNVSQNLNEVFKIVKQSENKGDIKLTFKKINSSEEGIKLAEEKGNIYLGLENNKVNIYTTSQNTATYYPYLSSIFKGIDKSVDVYKVVYTNNPMQGKEIMNSNVKINTKILAKDKAPGGFDYYSIAEITMICLYIMMFPIDGYFYDKKKKIKERMMLSGIKEGEYLIGSTLAYFIMSFAITIPGFLFTKLVLNANWGIHSLLYYGCIQVLALLSILIGTVLIYIFKDLDKITSIIQGILLPILSFLGGAYLSLPYGKSSLGIIGVITYISPLRWINKGIFLSIYNGESGFLIKTMIGFIVVILILIGAISLFIRKGEEKA